MTLTARGKNAFGTFWPVLHVNFLLIWHFLALQQKLGTVLENKLPMDYVRNGEIQGPSLVVFKAHCPCILPSLT